jgi:hypothetical protein
MTMIDAIKAKLEGLSKHQQALLAKRNALTEQLNQINIELIEVGGALKAYQGLLQGNRGRDKKSQRGRRDAAGMPESRHGI